MAIVSEDLKVIDSATPWRLVAMDPPSLEQAEKISNYLQGQLPGEILLERSKIIRWKLCENEAHPGFASAMVVGSADTIVSMATITPKRLWRKGKEQRWAETGDTFTDAAYLRKGMFGALVNANRSRAQAAGFRIIYGLPNEQSLPGYVKKLNFVVKENLVLDMYSLILSTQALGVRMGVSKIGALRRFLCHPLVVKGSRQLARLVLLMASPKHHKIRIEKEQIFGIEFDGLWQKIRARLPNAQVRDGRYLAWRYGKSPFSYDVLVARTESELLGYVATLTIQHRGENAFIHTILLDWLFDPSLGSSLREALLFRAVEHAVANKADVVTAVVSRTSPLNLHFARQGFVRRSIKMPVIFHGNDEGQELLADPSPWHFTMSDTDAF